MLPSFETLIVRAEGAVLFIRIDAPPMNLLGPALVRDLAALIALLDRGEPYRVVVFSSADPDYFIPHVDVTRVREYREAAAALTGEASIGLLFRRLSQTGAVTIAQVEGRVRGAGSEFILACDMAFAARETAIFAQNEAAFGVVPGAGGVQHLARRMGRARALEVMLGARDYDADLAERYGWINRALPAAELEPFVAALAHRIAGFPAAGHGVVKARVDAVTLASVDDVRQDSDLFGEGVARAEVQARIRAALHLGFQTRAAEIEVEGLLGSIAPG
jgi:enoyl-CoA hydratase/carnithine racemase